MRSGNTYLVVANVQTHAKFVPNLVLACNRRSREHGLGTVSCVSDVVGIFLRRERVERSADLPI